MGEISGLLETDGALSGAHDHLVKPEIGSKGAKWATFGKQNWRCGMNQTSS